MPTPRQGLAVGEIGGKMYAVSGSNVAGGGPHEGVNVNEDDPEVGKLFQGAVEGRPVTQTALDVRLRFISSSGTALDHRDDLLWTFCRFLIWTNLSDPLNLQITGWPAADFVQLLARHTLAICMRHPASALAAAPVAIALGPRDIRCNKESESTNPNQDENVERRFNQTEDFSTLLP
jgi:hypothetical protein